MALLFTNRLTCTRGWSLCVALFCSTLSSSLRKQRTETRTTSGIAWTCSSTLWPFSENSWFSLPWMRRTRRKKRSRLNKSSWSFKWKTICDKEQNQQQSLCLQCCWCFYYLSFLVTFCPLIWACKWLWYGCILGYCCSENACPVGGVVVLWRPTFAELSELFIFFSH